MTTANAKKSKAFKAGLAMRSKVLGPDYVKKQFHDPDDFTAPFQQVATEYAWGSVWTRPGLSLRDRSLITLAQCIAQNRPNEIRVHLRGAVRNGITRVELQELCVHSLVYCGGPASLDAFHTIKAALPEILALEAATGGGSSGKDGGGKSGGKGAGKNDGKRKSK